MAEQAQEATGIAGQLGSADPAVGLRAVAALRRLLEQVERLQIDHARELGWSWSEIATPLGVTKQTVHTKHANRSRAELLRRGTTPPED